MHVYDSVPTFDFNLTGFLGEMIGRFGGGRGFVSDDLGIVTFLVASLNSPVYVSVQVQDAKVVDKFIDQLDAGLARLARQPPAQPLVPAGPRFLQGATGRERRTDSLLTAFRWGR